MALCCKAENIIVAEHAPFFCADNCPSAAVMRALTILCHSTATHAGTMYVHPECVLGDLVVIFPINLAPPVLPSSTQRASMIAVYMFHLVLLLEYQCHRIISITFWAIIQCLDGKLKM
jgi:hypothetical protein